MVSEVLLHGVPDERLGSKLESCELTDSLEQCKIFLVVVAEVVNREGCRTLNGLGWSLRHPLELEILGELSPGQEAPRSEFDNSLLFCQLNFISLQRLLSLGRAIVVLMELLVEIGAEVADQSVEVVEFA